MTHDCQFQDQTDHGYGKVMVDYGLQLCEVGANCVAECPFSFRDEDVKLCPTCNGDPDIKNPPYACSTCDVFGIVRK